jgi:dolichol-phosphate mannosyltransferase
MQKSGLKTVGAAPATGRGNVVDLSRDNGTQLSVIVPTYNEKDNIAPMVASLERVLGAINWEVIFVDDGSPDGTAATVREIARHDRRVRLISRHNRRGLASAVVEGGLAATGEVIAVMDGDLQHDESVLPELYRRVASGEADVASASRFIEDHAREGLGSDQRLALSNRGIGMANKFFGLDLTDPLTGFFALRRNRLEETVPRLSGLGFKILLDLITSMSPAPNVSEVPFKFRQRVAGESKLDRKVMYDFFLFFMEKWIGRFAPIPGTWLSTALIASLGILAHLALVIPAVSLFGLPFMPAQLAAAILSVLVIFSANNWISRSDAVLKGARFWQGLAVFCLMSAIGVAANVGVAALVHRDYPWLIYVVPATAGAMISVVWNFIAGKAFGFWNRRTRLRAASRRGELETRRLRVVEGNQTPVAAAENTWLGNSPLARHQHLIKYLLIGGTASAIDVILFMLIYNLGHTSELVAHSISVPVSVIFSFVVNARHNFKTVDHVPLRLLSFVAVCTIGYLSGFGVIELCRQQGLDANLGKIISLPVVFAIQYVLNSRITFHKPNRAQTDGGQA